MNNTLIKEEEMNILKADNGISENEIVEITSYEEFEDVIKSLQDVTNNIHDIFEHRRTCDEHLIDGSTMQGKTAERTYARCKELEENYGPIEYSLNLYINFLKKTLEDYKLLDQAIDKNAEEFAQALDVNK